MSAPRLLALGGAHVDRRGRVEGAYLAGASNPGRMREEIGGGAFNALRMAVRRGLSGSLLSLRGGDAAGAAVAEAIAEAGIKDLSAVFLDRATPSYTALLDGDGELIAGLADMDLYEIGFARQIGRRKTRDAIAASDALLCDANLPAPALGRLAQEAGHRPLYAVAVSPAKVARLAPVLHNIACLFMNRRELHALAGPDCALPMERLRRQGLGRAVVTSGAGPAVLFDTSGFYAIDPPPPRHIADVTGAGDAIAGATIAALMAGRPFPQAVREGIAAAMLAIESADAVPRFTASAFEQALQAVGRPRRLNDEMQTTLE